MPHFSLEIKDLKRKPCDLYEIIQQRRKQSVQFPYVVLLLVIVLLLVFVGFYKYHLSQIPVYRPSLKDYIRESNRFYADLYYERSRKILLKSASIIKDFGTKNGSDVIAVMNGRDPRLRLCADINRHNNRSKVSENSPNNTDTLTMEEVEARNNDVMDGGSWKPSGCIARHRVAIVIPFRNRRHHLTTLLDTLVPILKLQNVHYKIYVSEQFGNDTFNKGVLMNAAYKQALQEQDWQCFVFHDVDLIPENVHNMYTCPRHPRHMSPAVDEMQYKLPYEHLVGGVFSLRTEDFRQLNGYSNSYWGWGAEDDDMSIRLKQTGMRIDRPPLNIARYRMLKHTKRLASSFKYRYIPLSKANYRFRVDGLNNLNYTLISKTAQPLYTHLLIDVGTPPI